MPNTKNYLLRCLLIDTRLRREPRPGLGELKQFVEKEFIDITNQKITIAKGTIKGDIKSMRKLFFAPIDFSFEKNCYAYTIPSYTFLKLPINAIENLISNIKLQYLLGGSKFNNNHSIQFETTTSTRGWEHVPVLTKAIGTKKRILFEYKGVNAKRSHNYQISPLLLKENRNCFYLLGMKDGENEIRIFALDRLIGKPELTEIESETSTKFDPDKYFENSIGVTVQTGKPVEVTLSFSPPQKPFLLRKPLHKSQKVLLDSEIEFKISFQAEPTYEVISNIMSYGDNVEVIGPVYLRELIANRLNFACRKYSK